MVGTNIELIIISPPIVGVPAFSTCPSKPRSLILSPTCFFAKKLMIRFPNINDINKETMTAIAALNEIY